DRAPDRRVQVALGHRQGLERIVRCEPRHAAAEAPHAQSAAPLCGGEGAASADMARPLATPRADSHPWSTGHGGGAEARPAHGSPVGIHASRMRHGPARTAFGGGGQCILMTKCTLVFMLQTEPTA